MVLTDGFNDPSTAFAAAAKLRASGAQVDVVGIGTREGAPVSHDAGGFEQDASGQPVLARLDPDRLQQLARAGGGDYVQLGALPQLMAHLRSPQERLSGATKNQDIQVRSEEHTSELQSLMRNS